PPPHCPFLCGMSPTEPGASRPAGFPTIFGKIHGCDDRRSILSETTGKRGVWSAECGVSAEELFAGFASLMSAFYPALRVPHPTLLGSGAEVLPEHGVEHVAAGAPGAGLAGHVLLERTERDDHAEPGLGGVGLLHVQLDLDRLLPPAHRRLAERRDPAEQVAPPGRDLLEPLRDPDAHPDQAR